MYVCKKSQHTKTRLTFSSVKKLLSQFEMADIENIYNIHVYQQNRKKKIRKSNIHVRNSWNFKITVIFWSRIHIYVIGHYNRSIRIIDLVLLFIPLTYVAFFTRVFSLSLHLSSPTISAKFRCCSYFIFFFIY